MTERGLPPNRLYCTGCAGLGVAPRLTPPHVNAVCPLCRGRGHVRTNTPPVDPRTGKNMPGVVYPRADR